MRGAGLGNTTISSQQLEHHLDECDPLSCILYSHTPSIQVYYALKSRLENSSEAWLQEFVSLDGLDSLLDSLGHMAGSKFSGFTDAILQIDCLSCIRAVLNSRVGMDTLVNSPEGVYKLLKGFDLANTLPRKHVVEILSAVCVYNKLAYRRLLDALDQYKKSRHLYHRFSFVVNELKAAETLPHKTTILTFINAIIISTSDRFQRCRIRNELIGLSLLDVLSFLQREDTDEDLYTQLQIFIEKKHEDETNVDCNSNLDLNSPQDLADAIQNRVFGGSKMVSFVNILQDLLAIELHEKKKSEALWQLIERHTHHLVHGCEDSTSLSEMDTESVCQALVAADLSGSPRRCEEKKSTSKSDHPTGLSMKKDSTSMKAYADSGYLGCEDKVSPPSYSTDVGTTFNFPTVSPVTHLISRHIQENERQLAVHNKRNRNSSAGSGESVQRVSIYDNSSPLKLPPKYAAPSPRKRRVVTSSNCGLDSKKEIKTAVPVKRIPSKPSGLNAMNGGDNKSPSEKYSRCNYFNYQRNKIAYPANTMKSLKWIKLDEPDIAQCTHCVWVNYDVTKLKLQPDFQQVEEMFREKISKNGVSETSLLSNTTRIGLNLFLNRLDEDPIAVVQRLASTEGTWLSLPFVKHLMDILPDHDEIKHLKYYNGSLLELGQAEQFLLHLLDLPNYRIILLGQLRRAEFSVMTSQLSNVLTSMLEISRVLLVSEGLKEMFMLILRLGNFLNHGQYNGYASGFKLGSLARLADVKSCEPGHNLVHFMVSLADSTDEQLLTFLNEIPRLEKAASYSPSQIKADFDKMNSQINTFVRKLASAGQSITKSFDGFLEEVKSTFRDLQGQISELKLQTQRLAEYFCEPETFDIQNCFTTILDFFKQLRLCRQEVQLLRKQKSISEKHSDMFNQQLRNKNLALKFGLDAGASSSMVEEKKPMVETLLTELHHGNFRPTVVQPMQPNARNSPKASAGNVKSCSTPERDVNQMELSRITLMGTPMLNRPTSEIYDGDLTLTALSTAPKVVTSSAKNLQSAPLTFYTGLGHREAPATAPVNAARTACVRTHHRSRSDLADSLNVTQKWIRYQEQAQQDNLIVPLAQPESSFTLATLNLEAGNRRYPYQQPISLIAGPTIALPRMADHSTDDEDMGPGQFMRNGKKGERKSGTLANFFSKISKALKQRNSEQSNSKRTPGNNAVDEGSSKPEKGHLKVNNGNCPSSPVSKCHYKENVHPENTGHRKIPTRLSGRSKGKSVK